MDFLLNNVLSIFSFDKYTIISDIDDSICYPSIYNDKELDLKDIWDLNHKLRELKLAPWMHRNRDLFSNAEKIHYLTGRYRNNMNSTYYWLLKHYLFSFYREDTIEFIGFENIKKYTREKLFSYNFILFNNNIEQNIVFIEDNKRIMKEISENCIIMKEKNLFKKEIIFIFVKNGEIEVFNLENVKKI